MKRYIWLMAGLALTGSAGELFAQFPFGPGYSAGIGFHYQSKRLQVGGFYYKSNFSTNYFAGAFPPVYAAPYPYPVGVVQRNITINVYPPPNIIVAPAQDYDLSGVDLDLVRPEDAFPSTFKVAGVKEPEFPAIPPPPAPMPGKDVSVPKKVIRPEDPPEPIKPKMNGMPGKPGAFPKPAPPLADPREESDRLIALGLEEFKEKKYGLAALYFKKAAQADPDNFLAHMLLAQAEFAFARFDQAVKAIRAAVKANKDYPSIKFRPRLSLYKGMEAEFADQLAWLQEAVRQNPKSPDLLFLLAHQLWFDDQREAALELLRKARPLAPDPVLIDLFLNAGKPKVVASK